MQDKFISISYPIIKFLLQEPEKELEKESDKPSKPYDWITIIYNTFFSTGHETNKQKET
uniref:Uncharacterized protein n=1 Tax=viral metagenome TaxID=1070528 RepID=A0A6C0LAJ9_9ZZZZ